MQNLGDSCPHSTLCSYDKEWNSEMFVKCSIFRTVVSFGHVAWLPSGRALKWILHWKHGVYEGDPRSNANSCVISFTFVILQYNLHQNYDAFSNYPNLITILTDSHSNPRCLATRECKVNDLGHV